MVFLSPIAIWKRVCIGCICMAQPGKGGVEMVYRPNLAFSRYPKNHHFRTPKNRHFFMKNRHFLMILKDPKLAIFEPPNLTKNPVFKDSKIEIFEDFFIMTFDGHYVCLVQTSEKPCLITCHQKTCLVFKCDVLVKLKIS